MLYESFQHRPFQTLYNLLLVVNVDQKLSCDSYKWTNTVDTNTAMQLDAGKFLQTEVLS